MKILYLEDNKDIEEFLKSFSHCDKDQDFYQKEDMVLTSVGLLLDTLNINDNNILKFGNLSINKFSNEVYVDGKVIDLSRREYDLLNLILINNPRITTLDKIRISLWKEYGHLLSNTVEVHINRINKKCGYKVIKCVKGFGYKLNIK